MARVSRKNVPLAEAIVHPAQRIFKTAVYTRLSVEDIRKKISDSIGTQRDLLLHYIGEHPDLELCEVYEDLNYTGTNFNRPAFTRMIEDIQVGRVDCVIVKDLSRFGRSFEETGNYLERVFPFLGVRFISVGDNYDSLTASLDESSLIVPIKNLMNEIYARDISKKTQAGFEAKGRRGEFCGTFAPYGYIKMGTSFVVDEEAAPVVRQIFAWLLDGHSDMAIAQKLNDMKILPPSRYRFEKGITKAKKHAETLYWYKSAVKRISENPSYTGVMVSGKYRSDFLRGGGRIEKDSSEWMVTPGAHPAIVSGEDFDAVMAIRKRHMPTERNGNSENIFKGLIYCGDCGKHMMRRKARKKHTFYCFVYSQVDKHACSPKPIREADLQAALFAYISREISLAVDMRRVISDLQQRASYQSRTDSLGRRIETLHNKLTQNRRFRSSLREDLRDSILSEQDYSTMKADYDAEKDVLQAELDSLNAEKQKQESAISQDNKWIREFTRFEAEGQLSSLMVTSLVERVDVYDGARIEVTLKYRDEFNALWSYVHDSEMEAVANG